MLKGTRAPCCPNQAAVDWLSESIPIEHIKLKAQVPVKIGMYARDSPDISIMSSADRY
jgi:hypothetical protein